MKDSMTIYDQRCIVIRLSWDDDFNKYIEILWIHN